MSVLVELATATRTIADQVGPTVVRIGRSGGRGSGVVIAPGRIVTNAHNLRGGQTAVTFADGGAAVAELVGADLDADLAVLAVDTGDIAPLEWAPDAAQVGDIVFTVARSAGGTTRTTWGTVSSTERPFRGPRGRRIDGSLEHTAPLAARSSGSPVVDTAGRLLALNTNRAGEGFYLALPADDAFRARVDALATGAVPVQRHLGVALAPSHVARKLRRSVGLPERDGLLVRGVDADQPAGRAGVQEGDLVVGAGGADIATVDDLYAALDRSGDELELHVVRGADELDLMVSFVAPADVD